MTYIVEYRRLFQYLFGRNAKPVRNTTDSNDTMNTPHSPVKCYLKAASCAVCSEIDTPA